MTVPSKLHVGQYRKYSILRQRDKNRDKISQYKIPVYLGNEIHECNEIIDGEIGSI